MVQMHSTSHCEQVFKSAGHGVNTKTDTVTWFMCMVFLKGNSLRKLQVSSEEALPAGHKHILPLLKPILHASEP
jgi:hypothetical protein